MKEFFKSFFGIDEARVSTLLILLVVLSIFGMYEYHTNKEITDNLLYWIGISVGAVAGVNGFNSVRDIFASKFNRFTDQDYNNRPQ